mgnify:CR=1 FL=1
MSLNRYVGNGDGTFAHYLIRAADIRLDLTGHAVLSFNLIGCHCVNFRYILLPHLCEAVIPL